MREIQASQITDVVEKLCIEANERRLGNCPGSTGQDH